MRAFRFFRILLLIAVAGLVSAANAALYKGQPPDLKDGFFYFAAATFLLSAGIALRDYRRLRPARAAITVPPLPTPVPPTAPTQRHRLTGHAQPAGAGVTDPITDEPAVYASTEVYRQVERSYDMSWRLVGHETSQAPFLLPHGGRPVEVDPSGAGWLHWGAPGILQPAPEATWRARCYRLSQYEGVVVASLGSETCSPATSDRVWKLVQRLHSGEDAYGALYLVQKTIPVGEELTVYGELRFAARESSAYRSASVSRMQADLITGEEPEPLLRRLRAATRMTVARIALNGALGISLLAAPSVLMWPGWLRPSEELVVTVRDCETQRSELLPKRQQLQWHCQVDQVHRGTFRPSSLQLHITRDSAERWAWPYDNRPIRKVTLTFGSVPEGGSFSGSGVREHESNGRHLKDWELLDVSELEWDRLYRPGIAAASGERVSLRNVWAESGSGGGRSVHMSANSLARWGIRSAVVSWLWC